MTDNLQIVTVSINVKLKCKGLRKYRTKAVIKNKQIGDQFKKLGIYKNIFATSDDFSNILLFLREPNHKWKTLITKSNSNKLRFD